MKKRAGRDAGTPDLFLSREPSWLEFNARVLDEAQDEQNPLLEKLRFAAIAASNLDEFFMVRVARLCQRLREGDTQMDPAGLTPARQLEIISEKAHSMMGSLYAAFMKDIVPALAARGIRFIPLDAMDAPQRAFLSRTFTAEILPALTPMATDSSRPFPMLSNLSLNLAVLLEPVAEGQPPRLAVVQVPATFPRLVRLPGGDGSNYAWLEEVIRKELQTLFPGQRLIESGVFRIVRDSELDLDDEGGRDLIQELEGELRKRRRSNVVRLDVEAGMGSALLEALMQRLDVGKDAVYALAGPMDVRALLPIADLPALSDLRFQPLKPLQIPEINPDRDMFSILDDRDILLHHPYDSFDPLISLLAQATHDPDVLAIKLTLYRTSGDSPVVKALASAAEQGKQVTALVELLARFDEESNIQWARRLEESGAHVIYGIRGYKTHSKILLIVRRTARGIRRYVHLGTGNYNDRTARLYTDYGLMTSDPEIGQDASAFFNALTGYSDPPRMRKLVMAPMMLRDKFLDLIEREKRRAEAGQAAEIRAKMNSLEDEELIRALYDASGAGVRVWLNVRGICCLRPGVKGVSENIRVVSVVDRFLEHARVFVFRNGGDEEVYLSSADWMPRNLDRRIELLFPVEDAACREKVKGALEAMFQDNWSGRWLRPDGTYHRKRRARRDAAPRLQEQLYREIEAAYRRTQAAGGTVLEPYRAPDQDLDDD